MKNSVIFLLFIITLYSCNATKMSDSDISKTEILATGQDFIDVDLKYFSDSVYTFGHKEIPKEDMEKIKAAIYRVYSNVELKNNKYILKINNGSDINISENLFKMYKENIDVLNKEAGIHLQKEASTNKSKSSTPSQVKLPAITKEYLNSLIKE